RGAPLEGTSGKGREVHSRRSSSRYVSELLVLFLMFLPAALRAHFRRCVQKDLQLCVGKNDRADIAPFHHHAATGSGTLLLGNEYTSHARDGCQPRSCLRYLGSANSMRHFPPIEEH